MRTPSAFARRRRSRRLGSPEDVASAMLYLLDADYRHRRGDHRGRRAPCPAAEQRTRAIGARCSDSVRSSSSAAAVTAAITCASSARRACGRDRRGERLIVVDRNSALRRVPRRDDAGERREFRLAASSTWEDFFARYLDGCRDEPERHPHDAIVPSPLMPHLMADWLLERAPASAGRTRRSHALRSSRRRPCPGSAPATDGTHYVSFAEWMCPINCIEPAHCPHTRGERDWSLPPALASYVRIASARRARTGGPFVFHCRHRAYGVGMFDTADVLGGRPRDRRAWRRRSRPRCSSARSSHCHGALSASWSAHRAREPNGSIPDVT